MKSKLFSGLKYAVGCLKKRRLVFLLLVILQFVFFVSFFIAQVNIQPKILELGIEMIDYLNSVESSPADLGNNFQGFLGDDPLLLYRNSKQIAYLIALDIIIVALFFAFIVNLMWVLSHYLLKERDMNKDAKDIKDFKGIKVMARQFLRFIAVFLAYSIPYLVIIFISLKQTLLQSVETSLNLNILSIFLIILTVVVVYLGLISFSLIHLPLKEILKKTFSLGVKKVHLIFPIILLVFVILSLVFILLFLSLDLNLFLFLVLLIVFISVYIFLRIFIIAFINSFLSN